jgi:predicted O-methyltransferase YrrM
VLQSDDPRPALPRPHAVTAPIPKLQRSIEKRLYAPWFWGKDFSGDWVARHIPLWRRVLAGWRDRPIRILEIGSWEGRSALFFLKFLPGSRITCIDTFSGGDDQVRQAQLFAEVPHVESRFDRNLAAYAARVEKIKSRSVPALEALAAAGRRFDLAYIDGSHLRPDVMDDSVRVWPLVVPGGVLIWDDYDWRPDLPDHERPQPAIDQFLAEHAGNFRLLARAQQMIVERLA